MKSPNRLTSLLAGAGALALAATTHAANLNINDATPAQITLSHDPNWIGGVTSNGSSFGAFVGGSTTASGEVATFAGEWIANVQPTGSGIIYIVDPGQPDLVRATIEGNWLVVPPFNDSRIELTITSTAFGDNLGTLPAAFSGLGVPMPDGSLAIQSLFRDTSTGSPVSIPSNLSIQYVGDLVPECEHPTLVSQTPDQANANQSDADGTFEQADDFTFNQDVTIRSLRWWGIYAFGNTVQTGADMFTLHVYENAGGVPAPNPVASFNLSNTVRAGTGQAVAGTYNEFVYAANLPAPLTLKANTTYWLAIINDTAADADDNWYWSQSLDGNNARAQRTPPFTGGWGATVIDRAIELCGSTTSLDCPSDFNGDNMTDGADLAVLLANWGPCGPALPLVVPTEPANRIDMLMNPADDASAVTSTQR